MEQGRTILCGANAYTQKYYLNPEFDSLPEGIKEELNILCVLYTEDIGGALTLFFDEEGCLQFETSSQEGDLLYDDIGSVLKIKQIQREKEELLESLELFYRVFYLGDQLLEEGMEE